MHSSSDEKVKNIQDMEQIIEKNNVWISWQYYDQVSRICQLEEGKESLMTDKVPN